MRYSISEFETLYARCFEPAMRLATCLLHDEDEARDIVQETFLKLWETETQVSNPTAFILRATRNACLNRLSSLDTRQKICRRLSLDPPPDDTTIDGRSDEVQSAIPLILTPREQQVVHDIYTTGSSYKEAAENLGISVAAVNKNIVNALRKLRTHFNTSKK